jgi:pimeloyl-ACP methyl ester carboxylesterase
VKIAVERAQLNVRMHGSAQKQTLVLLHAFPLHGGMWSEQMEAPGESWRVLAPDFRGFGASEVGQGQYAIDFFVDDLFAILDAPALKIEKRPVVACGLSMGGYVLLRAVEREPERFRALVLADTKSGADDDQGKLKRLDAVRTIRREGVAAFAKGFAQNALGPTTRSERPEVGDTVIDMITSNPTVGMVGAQLAMAARTDTTAALARIEVPTLVVVGAEDTLTPPELSKQMASEIEGSQLEIIPGAGHLPALETPDAFNEALKRFLDGLETDG